MKRFLFVIKIFLFIIISSLITLSGLYLYAYLSPGIDIKTSNSFYIYDNKEELVYQGSGNSEWVDIESVSSYFFTLKGEKRGRKD